MADVEMDDIEIDFSLEDPEIARLNAATAAMDAQAELAKAAATESEAMTGVEEPPEEGELDGSEPAPTKVYIRGLDQFHPKDIKQYVIEHGVDELFKNIQWIDDTSANLVFDTDRAAEDALVSLSVIEEADPRQLRAAKRLSTHPDTELEIRQATASDVKVNRAALHSRFYLDNPQYDPENRHANRKRRQDGQRGRNDRFKRSRNDRWEYRDPSPGATPFDVDLYDDKPATLNNSRRRSDDLFAGKQNGRLRGRSASPTRDGDGRYGFEEDQPRRRTARYRSRTPPSRRDVHAANREVQNDIRKELFPEKVGNIGALGENGMTKSSGDLFARGDSTPKAARELFPEKLTPTHRRREAKDLHPDEVASAIGKFKLGGSDLMYTYGGIGRLPDNANRRARNDGRDLFSRGHGEPATNGNHGRLARLGESEGFSIKGQDRTSGFNILGASKDGEVSSVVRELFPNKARNEGRDLFDGRIKGRANRRRAEDLN